MKPSLALRLKIGTLLAEDAATLAPATLGNKIALIKSPFVPAEPLVPGDLVFADFDGSSPLVLGTGTQYEGIDPITGEQVITLKEPAGGLRFETTGTTHLPQTIYGYALLSSDLATLHATALLPAPVTLTAANQFLVLDSAGFRLVLSPMA